MGGYRFRRMTAFVAAVSIVLSEAAFPVYAEDSVMTVHIDTEKEQKLISPYIYGIDSEAELSDVRVKALKQGDLRFSTYNWENNASNWGQLSFYENGFGLVSGFEESRREQPGLVPEALVETGALYNIPMTVTTLPLGKYAAADGNGPVLESQAAPSERWKGLSFYKPTPFQNQPNGEDDTVYLDEYINHLVQKFGKADSAAGIDGYALDFEPELLHLKNPVASPEPMSMDELITRSQDLAAVIKKLDSSAVVFGGEFAGIRSLADFSQPEEWAEKSGDYFWFLDYYLSEMKKASDGKRVIDVLDFHYFSEDHAEGCTAVSECGNAKHEECNRVRMQSTRTLWDGTYLENSGVGQGYQQCLPLLPLVRASVDRYYPGTKIALSAYNFGGGEDVSGGIAEADALGIFASQEIYMACLKPSGEKIPYQKAAINLYTNYDGQGSGFGNTLVKTSADHPELGSVYASINDGNPEVLKIILLNKNPDKEQKVSLYINSPVAYSSGMAYGFDADSPEIRLFHTLRNVSNNAFSYTVKPMTAVELILYTDEEHNPGLSVTTGEEPDVSEITVESLATTPMPVTTPPEEISTAPETEPAMPPEPVEREVPKLIKAAAIAAAILTAAGAAVVIFEPHIRRRRR